jgi:hypothetical protein
VTEFRPITGASSDASHPFPTPTGSDWIDSMEYGNEDRLPGNGMWDRDSTPIWRAVAANMWGQQCYEQHLAEIAADPILTAHTMALTVLAQDPGGRHPMIQLAFGQTGAGMVFAALKEAGQPAARRAAHDLPVDVRASALAECIAHINHGFTALRLDVGARFGG